MRSGRRCPGSTVSQGEHSPAAERAVRPDLGTYQGRRVRVLVDRPLGSRHPRYPDLIYRLNYSYLPRTLGGDGQPIDAYVLGVGAPVAEARGVVVAVVVREDDVEDKLVVGVGGRRYGADEIRTLVAFQERFFRTRIEMAPGDGSSAAPNEAAEPAQDTRSS